MTDPVKAKYNPSLWQALKQAFGDDTLLFKNDYAPHDDPKPIANPTDLRAIARPAAPDLSAARPSLSPVRRP